MVVGLGAGKGLEDEQMRRALVLLFNFNLFSSIQDLTSEIQVCREDMDV